MKMTEKAKRGMADLTYRWLVLGSPLPGDLLFCTVGFFAEEYSHSFGPSYFSLIKSHLEHLGIDGKGSSHGK